MHVYTYIHTYLHIINMYMYMYTCSFEEEVNQWDDTSNDIIVLAKEMCWMVMDMSDFLRYVVQPYVICIYNMYTLFMYNMYHVYMCCPCNIVVKVNY